MEPRECLCKHLCTPTSSCGEVDPECPCCNGTGKVWAAVKGEFVADRRAHSVRGSLNNGWYEVSVAVPQGRYRVVAQPLKEGEVKPCKS